MSDLVERLKALRDEQMTKGEWQEINDLVKLAKEQAARIADLEGALKEIISYKLYNESRMAEIAEAALKGEQT
jgi:hypothetical protein